MNLAFYIARRYLFAKKSHHAINIISAVSVCGVVVATIAMICILSVFNGFKELTTTLFSVFDPDLKITAVEGKVFDPTTEAFLKVCELPEIEQSCGVLQENAIVSYGHRQVITVLKGVDSSFRHLVLIDSAIIDGDFILKEDLQSGNNLHREDDPDNENADFIYYGVLGIGLANTLNVRAAFAYPLEIYIPDRTKNVNMANPISSVKLEYVYVGGVYHVNQPVYDEGFMLLSIDLLRSMLSYNKEITTLEVKLTSNADVPAVKKKIHQLIGDGYAVKDRYEQQETAFKVFQIEKWVSFLMMCFILVLALFNVLGSLAILMIEKEEDVNKLCSMGADNRLINRIFLFEGWMISLLGGTIGLLIGVGICFVQQQFGIIKLGQTAGTFIMDAYPVVVEWTDVFIVFLTVITVGFIAVLYPVYYIGKRRLAKTLTCSLLFLLIGMSCGAPKKDNTQTEGSVKGDKPEIAVTIEPLCYFAQHIAGDDYTFFSVVPAGRSPETYDPSFRERLRVEKSKAYFHINKLGLEQVLIKSVQENNAGTYIFDLSENLNFDQIRIKNYEPQAGLSQLREHDHDCDHERGHDYDMLTDADEQAHRHDDDDHDHDHDNDHDHDHDRKHDHDDELPADLLAEALEHTHHHSHHGGQDPHIWTTFTGAKVMSENIYQALSSINPSRSDYYKSNYLRLADELLQLEKELHEQLDTLSCRGFVIFHPALTYFAKEFDLIQYSMEEDGKDPSPASLKKLIEEARSLQVKVVFVQLEFDRSYAEQIATAIDARIVMINPLDHQWDVQMRRIAKALITYGEVD